MVWDRQGACGNGRDVRCSSERWKSKGDKAHSGCRDFVGARAFP